MTKKGRYYAIKTGLQTGVFEDWETCKQYVLGYPNADYRVFKSLTEAQKYLTPVQNISPPKKEIVFKDNAILINKYSLEKVNNLIGSLAQQVQGLKIENKGKNKANCHVTIASLGKDKLTFSLHDNGYLTINMSPKSTIVQHVKNYLLNSNQPKPTPTVVMDKEFLAQLSDRDKKYWQAVGQLDDYVQTTIMNGFLEKQECVLKNKNKSLYKHHKVDYRTMLTHPALALEYKIKKMLCLGGVVKATDSIPRIGQHFKLDKKQNKYVLHHKKCPVGLQEELAKCYNFYHENRNPIFHCGDIIQGAVTSKQYDNFSETCELFYRFLDQLIRPY